MPRLGRVVLWSGLWALGAGWGVQGQTPAQRIPELHGTALSGETVNLPEALSGKVGVLVLGFSQASRDAVSGWGRRLAADYRESPTVLYYELPVLASAPRLLRGMIVRSIKSSVPERAQPRFVPILENEQAWRSVARYDKPDEPYILLVDGTGKVVWQTRGAPSDTAYAALKQQVEALSRGR